MKANEEKQGNKYIITIEVTTNEKGVSRIMELESMLYHNLDSLLWNTLGNKVVETNSKVEKL